MSKDTIYREDATKAFVEETNGVNVEEAIKVVDAYLRIRECDEVWDSIRAIRDCLECAKDEIAEFIPSADRPQGEWVDAEIPLESGDTMPIQVCNLCKTFYPLAYTGGGHRFCPNCGAKMKGADNEEIYRYGMARKQRQRI